MLVENPLGRTLSTLLGSLLWSPKSHTHLHSHNFSLESLCEKALLIPVKLTVENFTLELSSPAPFSCQGMFDRFGNVFQPQETPPVFGQLSVVYEPKFRAAFILKLSLLRLSVGPSEVVLLRSLWRENMINPQLTPSS